MIGDSHVGPRTMNVIPKMLKPTALLGILFVLILLVQGAFFSSASMTYSMGGDVPDKAESSYGIGSPITATTVNGTTNSDIKWLALVGNLAACYLLAATLSKGFAGATRFRRPAIAYGIVALVMILVSFCVSIGISRSYWGYFFTRPPVLSEVNDVASVVAVFPVKTESGDEGTRRIVAQADYSLADRLAYGRKDRYYCLDERLLLALDKRSLLPSNHVTYAQNLPALYDMIQRTGILAEPTEGYNHSDSLRGVVIDAVDTSGKRLVLLGLTGMQLSNDHYPYYEMAFSGTIGSPDPCYVRGQRFFYDVAGIEGAEWYQIWPFFALTGIVIGFFVVTVVMLIRRAIRRTREAQPDIGQVSPEAAPSASPDEPSM